MTSVAPSPMPLAPSSAENNSSFALPTPPPQLHTRSTGEIHEAPSTPTQMGFTSPFQTPQGSPSKKQFPPGANDLPGVFDNALKLLPPLPQTPTKADKHQPRPGSPSKSGRQGISEQANDNVPRLETLPSPSKPFGRTNKENTPPNQWLPKEAVYTASQAAASRQEPYQSRETSDTSSKARYTPQRGLTTEELEKLQLPKVKRLANVTQLCEFFIKARSSSLTVIDFLDHYFDLLSYIHNRQSRQAIFNEQIPPPPATAPDEYEAAKHKYLGRERANLRKRRTRLRHGDFQILTQVGQGGYGQVYLAAKKDTREVCALKVMSKKLLFKLDEIRHILTERDILTAAKSEWLVKLLYAFQDEKSIYLAMVKTLSLQVEASSD